MTEANPKSLLEAVRYFSDLSVCNQYMRRIKWPNGVVVCPKCGAKGERIGEIATRSMLRCKDCRKQFSYKVGTIFEDSPLGLDKWFVAVWSVANSKNGISSHELGRALDVTQKTAWFMEHRIRKAMETNSFEKFDGPAEADTTYIGGKAENMHWKVKEKKITGRGGVNKSLVHGVLQRATDTGHSRIAARVVGNEGGETLMSEIRRRVRYGAKVFTDAATAYSEACFTHIHGAVDHSRRYVKDEVHINGVENFWSLFKRCLKGTFISVAPFHLDRYVSEEMFRFNERGLDDGGRFARVMSQVVGRRLTWRILTAQDDAGFMGLT